MSTKPEPQESPRPERWEPRHLSPATIEHIHRLVAASPPLTPEQVRDIAVIVAPALRRMRAAYQGV